jgi:pimeloyl-ACP methyl ester carboxylesterase
MKARLKAILCLVPALSLISALEAGEPRDVSFSATHDQSEQRYVLMLPEAYDSGHSHDLLVCLHGHGADRWQFVREQRGEARAARAIASQWNMILVSPDYRASTSWMGPTAEADLVQIIGDLKKQYGIRRVVLSGGSMGATSALTFTALHPDLVDGVVALNGHANHVEYTNFQDAIQLSFGGTKEAVPEEYRRRSAEFFAERFTMPVAITAGGKDTTVPAGSVMRLVRAIQKHNPAALLDFQEPRGHETDYDAALAAYEFVMRALWKPVTVSVVINGKTTPPAPGSVAGVWFYADGPTGAQALLTGHANVPGSWRMTASLNAGDEARVSFVGGATEPVRFRAEPLSPQVLGCSAETNALIIKAGAGPGAVRLTRFAFSEGPACFAPERRPFSRGPVSASPDPCSAVAEALVEWDWRMQDGIQTPREPRTYRQALEKIVRQVDALLSERLASSSLSPDAASEWKLFRAGALSGEDNNSAWETRWLQAHRLRRQIVLSNPLFKLPPLLFAKHVPSVMSHQLTQVYGYCARPGGGLFVLTEPGVSMRTRDITPASLPAGNFMTPELSYDARKILFAYCPVKEAPASWDFNEQTSHLRYHIHELALDSGDIRPLTKGDTDNFSPLYLPSGEVLFLSTRRGGYHRCGRGPCFVYTLARMGPNGQNARSISFHETHEWDPCLLNDGRVVYTRWDYVDRNAVHYEQLWSALPDGGNARIYYGNNTWNPTGIWEPRAIPGSSRIMAIAAPHHGMSAGSVILVDPARGLDGKEPLTRLTPDVRFPESESPLAFGPNPTGYDFDTPVKQYWRAPLVAAWSEQTAPEEEKRWPGHCYKSPWPLSEKFFIVSYSFDQLVGEPGPNMPNMFGLYFADAFGNKELIYRDPAISSLWARPLAKRPPPPDLQSLQTSTPNPATGTFFLRDVMNGWPYLPADSQITHLRVIQVLLKTTPNADSPRVGAAFAAPGKQVLGTVPVEADGSAFFEVPARTPVLFQALDAQGRAVQTMRSLVYLQPGERQSCVGCHEHRMKTPAASATALALRREPSRIKPGPDGSRPFSYARLVQPILNRHCVPCHDGKEAKRPVLTGEPEGAFSKSYNALVERVSFTAWNRPQNNFEPVTEPLRFGALASPLAKLLDRGHNDVKLSSDELERLNTWMDANALFYGTFDVNEQKRQLAGQAIAGPKE